MSLDTVLRIGKIYRQSIEYGLDEHRYINKVSDDLKNFSKNKDDHGQRVQTVIFNIPVSRDADGNWHIQLAELTMIDLLEEDRIKGLRYLNYKTSDKDSLKKYFFGDITYTTFRKDGKLIESGSYRLDGKSSFYRSKEEMAGIVSTTIQSFRQSFEENISAIEGLLKSASAVALHFDFQGYSWYAVEGAMDAINQKLVEEFAAKRTLPNGREVVALSKTIFKTIKSPLYDREKNTFGDPDGIGGCVPAFRNTEGYKIRYFESLDEVIDLFYAVSTAEKKFAKRIKDVGILALPRAENLTARQLNAFFDSRLEYDETEENLMQDQQAQATTSEIDEIFAALLDNDLASDVTFDIIFMKPPGMSTPSVDLVEISNIQKSFLREVHEEIRGRRNHWEKEAAERIPGLKKPLRFSVANSFQQLLDNRTKEQKKYQSHLLKVLPQIYSDTYYRDPVLLPLLIEQAEYGIRQEKTQFNFLKYYFYFLTSIQKHGEMNMHTITTSSSYQMGLCLGVMSKPFAAWRKDCPIKSFEKSYVGNLSRRILSPSDATTFANFLNEKLTIHEQYYPEQREAFQQFLAMLKSFESNSKEKYDRHNCALGFFEGYHSPMPEKETENEISKN